MQVHVTCGVCHFVAKLFKKHEYLLRPLFSLSHDWKGEYDASHTRDSRIHILRIAEPLFA